MVYIKIFVVYILCVAIGVLSAPTLDSYNDESDTYDSESESESESDNIDYKYKVKIQDDDTYNYQQKVETKVEGVIKGVYTVLEPNGSFRIVKYIADDDGFRAEVTNNDVEVDYTNYDDDEFDQVYGKVTLVTDGSDLATEGY